MAAAKRKWAEVDWEIAMEAMSYVAVFADPVQDDELSDDEQEADTKKTKPAGKTTKTSAKKKKKAATGGKKKKKKTAPTAVITATKKTTKGEAKAASTARATRASAKKEEEEEEKEEDGADKKNAETKAAAGDATTPEPVEEFWIARLLDDVTRDMLEDESASVHVTWLNKVTGQTKKDRYVNAFDDTIAVQAILCHVYLVEFDDESMEITPKSLKRVSCRVTIYMYLLLIYRTSWSCSHKSMTLSWFCRLNEALSAPSWETLKVKKKLKLTTRNHRLHASRRVQEHEPQRETTVMEELLAVVVEGAVPVAEGRRS